MAPSRVTKSRSNSKHSSTPIQFWDGRTYACNACKRGHRVKQCDHGKDGKLISATNQPGRPSSGSDRKCTCPKSCKCAGNCKCVKDGCMCVQQMFLIVALKSRPKPVWVNRELEEVPRWTDEDGVEKTLNPVYTDMNGNVLSPEEAKEREEERERRRNEDSQPLKTSCCASKQSKQDTHDQEPSPIPPTTGCRHKEQLSAPPAPIITPNPQPLQSSRCTCGVKCQCTLCPEHPNNTATQQYNAQQLHFMAHNADRTYLPTQSTTSGQMFRPEVPQQSCLGGEASYFLTREQPTAQDFQRLFPDYAPGDFVLTYPMDAPTQTYNHMNSMPPVAPFMLPATSIANPIPMLDVEQTLTSGGGIFGDTSWLDDQPLDFTFGDADVTTFGNQSLLSPAIQSPGLTHSHTHSPEATSASPSHAAPTGAVTSQTISPDLLLSGSALPTPMLSRGVPAPHQDVINQDIFFDHFLAQPEQDQHALPSPFQQPSLLSSHHTPIGVPLSPPVRRRTCCGPG